MKNTRQQAKIEGIEQSNPNGWGGMVSRAVAIERAKNFDEGIDTIATTEQPAMVVDWERWQIVREILPMRYMEAPKNDKVPLLDSHSRISIEKIKGSAKNFKTQGDKLLAKTFVSASEQQVREKITEGHIDSVSIGYMTDKDYSVEIPKGASVSIDGVQYRNDYEDGVPMVVRTWWKVHELSLVPIGADDAAKFKSVATIENTKLLDEMREIKEKLSQLENKEEKRESTDWNKVFEIHERILSSQLTN